MKKDVTLPLSLREWQLALLIAEGLTNPEMADRLGLSVFTARNEVVRILRKLKLRNRTQIAVVVVQQVRRAEDLPDRLPGDGGPKVSVTEHMMDEHAGESLEDLVRTPARTPKQEHERNIRPKGMPAGQVGRNVEISEWYRAGAPFRKVGAAVTLKQLAVRYSLTRERIRQIISHEDLRRRTEPLLRKARYACYKGTCGHV